MTFSFLLSCLPSDAYHEGMLIVKMQPLPPGPLGPTAMIAGGSIFETPAMSVFSSLERSGMIKRVVNLAKPDDIRRSPLGFGSPMSVFAAVSESSMIESPNAGVSIIELERDKDVDDVQISIAKDPRVVFASRVPRRYLFAAKRTTQPPSIAAVPPPPSTMWNLRKIQWEEARALGGFTDANQIKVAVLDTGIESLHPDLVGRVSRYTFDHPDTPDVSSDKDLIGHGTHVAGTIAALFNNNIGVNGICSTQLFIWKIFDDVPDFNPFSNTFVYFVDPVMYRRALADCIDEGVDVINLSIGGPGRPDPQELALFNTLIANGTTVVAAMGNERRSGSPTSFPAAIQGVIAVGATNIDDTVANFSNSGNHISISAPGVAIWSTLPTYPGQFGFEAVLGPGGKPIEGKPFRRETDYDAWNGTSMASPHVAGASALLLANKGKMNSALVRNGLINSADKVAAMGNLNFHADYGFGRLNLLRLLQ